MIDWLLDLLLAVGVLAMIALLSLARAGGTTPKWLRYGGVIAVAVSIIGKLLRRTQREAEPEPVPPPPVVTQRDVAAARRAAERAKVAEGWAADALEDFDRATRVEADLGAAVVETVERARTPMEPPLDRALPFDEALDAAQRAILARRERNGRS